MANLKNVLLWTILTICFFSIKISIGQNNFIDSLKQVVHNPENSKNPDKSTIKSAIILSDYYSKVSLDSATFYAKLGNSFAQAIKNDTGIAVSINMIGMSFLSSGFYDSAAPYLDSALNLFITMGDTTGIIFVRNNLAVAMKIKGNYTEALELYQENLTMAIKRAELQNMLLSYNNIGIAYFDWKKYDQALENYYLALNVLDSLGEENRKGSIYNNIGELYKETGDNDQALNFFTKALEIHKKFDKNRSTMITTMNIGDIYNDIGKSDLALEYLKKALAISESIPDNTNTAMLNIHIGQVYVIQEKPDLAYKHIAKGLKIAGENDLKKLLLEAYQAFVDYARLKGDPEMIYKYGSKYMALNDSLFNERSLNAISEMETKFKTVEKEKQIAVLTVEKKNKDLEIQLQRNQKYIIVIILLLILISVFLLFNRNRLKQIKEKAKLEKLKVSIEQRMLKSQMNPHFIFNSLNSINSFIGENNTAEAQIYLTKFARLMRLILENSRKTMVSLSDEVSALELNLELEQLRFEGKFDFEIFIDPSLETEDVYLSPMLIQPFVENSIKHGLRNNKSGGMIALSFIPDNGLLICEVTDNGIGRKASENIGMNKHVSLGTEVTNERLNMLKQDSGKNAGFEIIDLTDNNNHPTGTKVIIRIPFEEE